MTYRGNSNPAQGDESPAAFHESHVSPGALLTVREVAGYLRVNERTVRRWIMREGLPCIHLGTRLRFSQRNVLRWVSAREEGR